MSRVRVGEVSTTAEQVSGALEYIPETGFFYWKISYKKIVAGKRAGNQHCMGYRRIGLFGFQFYEQRLAWVIMTGAWPKDEIDHKDLCKSNNKWKNLREATHLQNTYNRRSRKNRFGIKGIGHSGRKFTAKISVAGEFIHLGSFASKEEARVAYEEAALRHHGEFRRTE